MIDFELYAHVQRHRSQLVRRREDLRQNKKHRSATRTHFSIPATISQATSLRPTECYLCGAAKISVVVADIVLYRSSLANPCGRRVCCTLPDWHIALSNRGHCNRCVIEIRRRGASESSP